jgi:hypothetical protein
VTEPGPHGTRRPDDPHGDTRERLVGSFTEVVEALLGIGVSLTRTAADLTARGRPVPPPEAPKGPVAELLHYGVLTVRNVLGLVFSVSESSGGTASVGEAAPKQPTQPVVQRGEVLRIPLAVENPHDRPMLELAFRCLDIGATELGEGVPVDGRAFRFEPATLTVMPHDFEKLTMYIATAAETAPGRYRASIGVEGGEIELAVQFEVTP